MKKMQVTAALVVLCGGLAFAQNGVITNISGTVELLRAGSSAYVAARTGDEVGKDTVISTGFKSSALIKAGSATVTVRPLTRLSFGELSAGAGTETISMGLQTGRVRVDVNPPAGTRTNMSVRGPSATASVRGTSFIFDAKNVSVREGTVTFIGKRGPVMLVSAGSSSRVKEDRAVSDPLETGAAALLPLPPAGKNPGSERDRSPITQVEFGFVIGYPP